MTAPAGHMKAVVIVLVPGGSNPTADGLGGGRE